MQPFGLSHWVSVTESSTACIKFPTRTLRKTWLASFSPVSLFLFAFDIVLTRIKSIGPTTAISAFEPDDLIIGISLLRLFAHQNGLLALLPMTDLICDALPAIVRDCVLATSLSVSICIRNGQWQLLRPPNLFLTHSCKASYLGYFDLFRLVLIMAINMVAS